MKTKLILGATMIAFATTFFVACKKDGGVSGDGNAKVQIKMTDAPGNFGAINLDVKEIVLVSGDKPYVFAATTSRFNILDFRIGTAKPDILVAEGEMPIGDITEIRLVLNNNNTIIVDGVEQPLTTPSAQSSGWKVKLTENPVLTDGITYTLLLDFDASKSIVKTGNGKYILKPVVRGVTVASSGIISGSVMPLEAHPEVLAISGTDTVGTVANALTGQFTIGGLAAGNYKLKIVPVEGYRDTTLTNVSLILGQNVNVGQVNLKAQ